MKSNAALIKEITENTPLMKIARGVEKPILLKSCTYKEEVFVVDGDKLIKCFAIEDSIVLD